jgi:hypothetical protein
MYYIPLYKVIRNDGGITITAEKPNEMVEPTQIRVIANDGKRVTTDRVNLYLCRDVDIVGSIDETLEPWYEVDVLSIDEDLLL